MKKRRMRIAFRVTKATNTRPEYEILIAFPLHERPLMLCYTCIAFLVFTVEGQRVLVEQLMTVSMVNEYTAD
jgi:hypothetical protein